MGLLCCFVTLLCTVAFLFVVLNYLWVVFVYCRLVELSFRIFCGIPRCLPTGVVWRLSLVCFESLLSLCWGGLLRVWVVCVYYFVELVIVFELLC